jgi:hypothetical protein
MLADRRAVQLLAGLLITVAVVNIGPELLETALAHSRGAWEYVLEGAQAALLWCAVLALAQQLRAPALRAGFAAVCTYGAVEGILRAHCRLLWPMTGPPPVPRGQGLCSAAGYPWWTDLTPMALALCALACSPLCRKASP